MVTNNNTVEYINLDIIIFIVQLLGTIMTTTKFSLHYDIIDNDHTRHYVLAEVSDGRRLVRNCIVANSSNYSAVTTVLDNVTNKLNSKTCHNLSPLIWNEIEPEYGTIPWSEWHCNRVFDKDFKIFKHNDTTSPLMTVIHFFNESKLKLQRNIAFAF